MWGHHRQPSRCNLSSLTDGLKSSSSCLRCRLPLENVTLARSTPDTPIACRTPFGATEATMSANGFYTPECNNTARSNGRSKVIERRPSPSEATGTAAAARLGSVRSSGRPHVAYLAATSRLRIKRLPVGFIIPAQPVLVKTAVRSDWVHESNMSATELSAPTHRAALQPHAYDWTARLAAIAAAAERIKATSFTIDGDAVALGPDGLSRFEELSRRDAARTAILYSFDLIEHNGEDLRN